LSQSFTGYELIILDDCSDDGSRELIDSYALMYPEIIRSYNASNSGSPFAQWNHGISMAKGDYIWIAESDDYSEPGFLEKTTAMLDARPGAGLVYTDSIVIDEGKGINYLSSDRKKLISGNIFT
jgi:glycosyltransferase involved in cell wall biosynthesis